MSFDPSQRRALLSRGNGRRWADRRGLRQPLGRLGSCLWLKTSRRYNPNALDATSQTDIASKNKPKFHLKPEDTEIYLTDESFCFVSVSVSAGL